MVSPELTASVVGGVVGALAGVLGGTFLAIWRDNRQRQRNQWWNIYLGLRILTDLDSEKCDKMPEPTYQREFMKHREEILRNLVASALPETKEIIRAVNWIGFPNTHARHLELDRLADVVLKRVDPEFFRAYRELLVEYAPFKEGDTVEDSKRRTPESQKS